MGLFMEIATLLLLSAAAFCSADIQVLESSNDGPHPSSLHMAVHLPDGEEKAYLQLSKLSPKVNYPITMSENGVETTFPQHLVQNSSGHYFDDASGALISSRRVNGRMHFAGHFSHQGKAYFLTEPMDAESEHVAVNAPDSLAKTKEEIQGDIIQSFHNRRSKRQTVTTATTNTIEIYLLVDNSAWDFVKSQTSSETDAINFFNYYYKHLINGVDRTYRNIPGLSISVECIGVFIAKSAADAPWVSGTGGDGSAILTKLQSFVESKGFVADHFAAVTRVDIHGDGSFGVIGMAPVSRTCQRARVSINEDGGLHSWGTIAHEIGHNLGSNHDGSGNYCDPNQKNVMTSSSSMFDMSDIGNSYRFSSCSIDAFRNYINGLNSQGKNCLTKNDGARKAQFTNSQKAGSRWTLDQVCKFAMKDSLGVQILSDATKTPALICAKIACKFPGGMYRSSGGLRAPVGTPCGSRKSCDWNGQCVYDSSAPTADEKCFFGDAWDSSTCAGYAEQARQYSGFRAQYCASHLIPFCCKSIKNYCDDYKTK